MSVRCSRRSHRRPALRFLSGTAVGPAKASTGLWRLFRAFFTDCGQTTQLNSTQLMDATVTRVITKALAWSLPQAPFSVLAMGYSKVRYFHVCVLVRLVD